MEIEAKKSTSRPASSQGSRPSSSHSTQSERVGHVNPDGLGIGPDVVVVKNRPKVNPFGDAKPREVVLEEKGMDWRRMDMELEYRGVDRVETQEERTLKEEMDQLKGELSNGTSEGFANDRSSLRDQIYSEERDLKLLTKDLDEKVQFGQKTLERPGSGAGRPGSFPERSPSQSGSSEDLRGMEHIDQPRSPGTDVWTRRGEDRIGSFHGSRDRGFFGSRSRSRDRW